MTRGHLASVALIVAVAAPAVAFYQLPGAGAAALLRPVRTEVTATAPATCAVTEFAGAGVTLRGWHCRAPGRRRRGTLVYLHGVADNRGSAAGIVDRFGRLGFDVLAYDSRAHGESTGELCTYGFFEKQDLARVVATLPARPIVLMGASLGAAVALQHAPDNPRVTAVVAAETFSDLRTVATERAPFFFTAGIIERAIQAAETTAAFKIDEVSPVMAAERLTIPALIIHGEADTETVPDHSRRVFEALRGPKRLIIVPGAGHNGSLQPAVWDEIVGWLDVMVPAPQ